MRAELLLDEGLGHGERSGRRLVVQFATSRAPSWTLARSSTRPKRDRSVDSRIRRNHALRLKRLQLGVNLGPSYNAIAISRDAPMSERLNAEVIEAAGGIVVRDTPEGPLVAVIYRERYGPEWGLPKGKRQVGESWQQTALREVGEEIGLKPTIVGVAGATAYLADGVPKLVFYWRMRADGEASPFMDSEEVKKLAWLSPAKAIERLTHAEEAGLVRCWFTTRAQ
jgi:8-oxo-dGTP pyrophosphatase MutT (NUDIX family)